MYRRGVEEEMKRRKERRERVRVKGDKGAREASISLFLRKRNHALSPLLTEERERLKRQKQKIDVAYMYFD
jgi:hypothetical protein